MFAGTETRLTDETIKPVPPVPLSGAFEKETLRGIGTLGGEEIGLDVAESQQGAPPGTDVVKSSAPSDVSKKALLELQLMLEREAEIEAEDAGFSPKASDTKLTEAGRPKKKGLQNYQLLSEESPGEVSPAELQETEAAKPDEAEPFQEFQLLPEDSQEPEAPAEAKESATALAGPPLRGPLAYALDTRGTPSELQVTEALAEYIPTPDIAPPQVLERAGGLELITEGTFQIGQVEAAEAEPPVKDVLGEAPEVVLVKKEQVVQAAVYEYARKHEPKKEPKLTSSAEMAVIPEVGEKAPPTLKATAPLVVEVAEAMPDELDFIEKKQPTSDELLLPAAAERLHKYEQLELIPAPDTTDSTGVQPTSSIPIGEAVRLEIEGREENVLSEVFPGALAETVDYRGKTDETFLTSAVFTGPMPQKAELELVAQPDMASVSEVASTESVPLKDTPLLVVEAERKASVEMFSMDLPEPIPIRKEPSEALFTEAPEKVAEIETALAISEAATEFAQTKEESTIEPALPTVQEEEALHELEAEQKAPAIEMVREGEEAASPLKPERTIEMHPIEELIIPEIQEQEEVSAAETAAEVSEASFEFSPKKEKPIVELALPEVQEEKALYEPEVEKKLPRLEDEPKGAEIAFPLVVERGKEMPSVEELILPDVQEQETLAAEERKEEVSTTTMAPVTAESPVPQPPWKEREPELQARELQAVEALKAASVAVPSAYAPPPMPLLPRVEYYASGVPQPDLVAKPPLTEGGQEKEPFREIIRGEGFQPYVPGREQELHEDLLLPEVYEDQSAHAAWTPMEVSAIGAGPLVSEAPFEFAPKKEEPIVELALPEVQEKEALYEPEVEKKLPTLEAEPEGAEMAFPLEVERVKEMSSVEELILPEVQEQETLGAEERKEEAVHRCDDTGLRGDSSIAAAMERKRTRAASTGTSSRGSA
ncbi:hypothetical protein V5799_021729 [Amblyomma americanum]|uniref:Uncharacterized protein n=1 Tax=Amblyomma americanum TaxID=6943 RepID=A0AAQ4FP27_AMBAM